MRPCHICGVAGSHASSCPARHAAGARSVVAYCARCDDVIEVPGHLRPEWIVCPQCGGYRTSQLPEIAPPAARVLEPVPEIDGELVGFRQWAIDPQTWTLSGLGVGVDRLWRPGVNEALCPRHRAPAEDCDCGFNVYAHPHPLWAAQRQVGGIWKARERTIVTGALTAWGDEFYLHPGGFRAQYARPVLFAIPTDCPRPLDAAIRALADDYGCDTCDFPILEGAAREHGQLVPDAMLPDPEPELNFGSGFGITTAKAGAALEERQLASHGG